MHKAICASNAAETRTEREGKTADGIQPLAKGKAMRLVELHKILATGSFTKSNAELCY